MVCVCHCSQLTELSPPVQYRFIQFFIDLDKPDSLLIENSLQNPKDFSLVTDRVQTMKIAKFLTNFVGSNPPAVFMTSCTVLNLAGAR